MVDAGMDASRPDDGPMFDGGTDAMADVPGEEASTLPDCGPNGVGPTFTLTDVTSGQLSHAALALTPDGKPRIAFVRDQRLYYTAGSHDLDAWAWLTTSVPVFGGPRAYGQGASLLIDAEGTAHVAFIITEGTGANEVIYKSLPAAASDWTEEIAADALGGGRGFTALSRSSAGTIAIAIDTGATVNGAHVVTREGPRMWTHRAFAEDRFFSNPASLAVDGSGTFATVVVHDLRVWFARLDAPSVTLEPIDFSSVVRGFASPVVAFKSSGDPIVAAVARDQATLVSSRTDGRWQPLQVEADPAANNSTTQGRQLVLAVDAEDRAHVVYIHRQDHAVRYARQNGCTWDISTVESGAPHYSSVSLALDASGHPHVAFLRLTSDSGNAPGALVYAH
jgi:hypothetical protein